MPRKGGSQKTIQNSLTRDTLSPKELAQAIEASESSIKRWIDEGRLQADRTLGGHRRIPLARAIQFIRTSHLPLMHPEVLGLSLEGGDRLGLDCQADRGLQLSRLLEEGRGSEASGLLLGLYLSGWSLASICDGPIREAMERIGVLWLDRSDGVFLEHRAAEWCARGLHELRRILILDSRAPRAVGGAPSGDPYQLTSLCAATVLAGEGLNSINLGPNTPFEALLEGVDTLSPLLVWLSVSYVDVQEDRAREFDRFRRELEKRGIPLMIGGRERRMLRFTPGGILQEGGGMGELASFAKGLLLGERRATE